MSRQPKSGGEQLNDNYSGGSAHQLPKSGVVQLNDKSGRSARRRQLSEAQIAANNEIEKYRPLFFAAQRGDWKSAISSINHDPNALIARITADSQTVLHVAAFCCQWRFVLKLLELPLSPESIALRDNDGNTILHFVAQGGSLKTAKALVKKNGALPQMVDNDGHPPLLYSIFSQNKELIWYLTLITSWVESPNTPNSLPFIPSLPVVLRILTQSGSLDVALYLVQKYPNLALVTNDEIFWDSLLYCLATNPSYFFSGSNLGFLERWIYKFVHVEITNSPTHLIMVTTDESTEGFPMQTRSLATQVLQWFKRLLWKAIAQLAPSIQIVRDAKLKHECAVELVNHVCKQISSRSFQEIRQFLRIPNTILGSAVRFGIEEFVRTIIQHFPDLIYYPVLPERNILQAAIEYRQEKIVNIIKEISPTGIKNLCSCKMESKTTTTLHLVGKLAPAFKLFSVSGAALQMQRELQWFKEVEKITFHFQREWPNMNNDTPKDVFRIEHKELAEQGEKWMKDTANSCMLVSTLIATVLFAAAFTVPGGNINDKGIPICLRMNAFVVFAISDALGLFSSLTSLLMFLAILTSRYGIEDFLESLPKKLIIGLGSLFVAIAAMIIAFGATLTIVLSERWNWVSMPITLMASFPVTIFVLLQLPLFIQIVQSTYGSSIFHPSQDFE